jgi:hypothetical protein
MVEEGTRRPARCDDGAVPAEGERMLIRCQGGPSTSRLAWFPPPLEVIEVGGTYVLVDEGPPQDWWYEFVPAEP